MRRSFFLAVPALVGLTIGAGAFALPSLFARFGIWQASLCFWFLAACVIIIKRLYVDVILAVQAPHRLPGYVRLTLGKRVGAVAVATYFFPMYAGQVVYLMLGSVFFQSLLAWFGIGVPRRLAMLAIFAFVAAAMWGGLRRVARVDAAMVVLNLVLFTSIILAAAFRGPAPTRLIAEPSWEAFGLVLFALSALAIIPEVVELTGRQARPAKRAVTFGTLLAALFIWLFAVSMARAGGTQLTSQPESLLFALPAWARLVLPLMGLVSIGTAYLTTAEALQGAWRHDYGFRFAASWLVTLLPSLFLALLIRDGFMLLVTIIGTVCGGINGMLVGMMRVAIAERKRELLALGLGLTAVFIYGFGVSGQIATWLFL